MNLSAKSKQLKVEGNRVHLEDFTLSRINVTRQPSGQITAEWENCNTPYCAISVQLFNTDDLAENATLTVDRFKFLQLELRFIGVTDNQTLIFKRADHD